MRPRDAGAYRSSARRIDAADFSQSRAWSSSPRNFGLRIRRGRKPSPLAFEIQEFGIPEMPCGSLIFIHNSHFVMNSQTFVAILYREFGCAPADSGKPKS